MFSTINGQGLSMRSGWRAYGHAWGSPTVVKTGTLCLVSGLLRGSRWGHTMAKLPSDCRPKGRLIFNMNNHASSARVDVLRNGDIRWVTGGRHHSWISVTGIVIHRNGQKRRRRKSGLSTVRIAPNQFRKRTGGVSFVGSEVRVAQGNYFADTKQRFTRPTDMSIQLHQWGGSSECGVVSLFPQRNARHSGYNAGTGWWGRYFGAGRDGSIGRRGGIPANNANRWNTVRINARADGWVDFYLNGARRYRIRLSLIHI